METAFYGMRAFPHIIAIRMVNALLRSGP
jgi:hypothetical protein